MIIKLITIILIIAGLLGTFLPILPGTPLIIIGAIIYGYSTNFTGITIFDLVLLAGLGLFAEGMQYLLSMVGSRKFGGSKVGSLGAVLGLLLGMLLIGPIGLLIGPLLGAILAELLTGQELYQAVKVGIGSMVGVFGGMVMTLLISIIMTVYVLIKIF